MSLDAINAERGLDGGRGIPVEDWARANHVAHRRVAALLRRGAVAVVDDTSSPRFLRDGWRELAAAERAGFVLVHVDATEQAVRDRVAANRVRPVRHDVTDAVLADHLEHFEPPGDDEPHLRYDATSPAAGALDVLLDEVRETVGG